MASGAANLLRQPTYAAFVGLELGPNDFSDMYFALSFHCLSADTFRSFPLAMKKRESHFLMSLWALESLCTISNMIHAKHVNLCLLIPVLQIFQIYNEGIRAKALLIFVFQ